MVNSARFHRILLVHGSPIPDWKDLIGVTIRKEKRLHMRLPTLIFHRQVLRLCKGILKAWEQWVDESEQETPEILEGKEPLRTQKKYGEQYEKIMKS
jgi:hypothetical protein